MNYVIAARIPNNLAVDQMLHTGPNEWTLRALGVYTDLYAPEIDASYISLPSMDNVLTLAVDSVIYTKVDTDAERFANEKTFTWTQGTRELVIHFASTVSFWSVNTVTLGVTLNFFKTNLDITQFNGISNGIAYKRLLASTPDFSDSFDNIFDGKQTYSPSSFKVQNEDGAYSRLNEDDNFIGRAVLIESWFGTNDYDYNVVLSQETRGIITKIEVGKTINIEYKDSRDKFYDKTPTRKLDLTTWTMCQDNHVIPEIWGSCRRVPLKCLNENDTSVPNWQFMLADVTWLSLHSLDYIYISGARTAAPTILISADNIAYIEILKSSVPDKTAVTADVNGYKETIAGTLIESPLDIIRHKIWQIYGHAYNSTYFDTDAWELALVYARAVGLFLNTETEFKTQIESISGSSGGFFYVDRTTDKYTFRIIGSDMSTQFAVYEKQYLPKEDRNEIEYDYSQIISVVKIGYNKRYSDGEYSWYTDDTRAADIALINGSENKTLEIRTQLTNYDDAVRAASMYLDLFGRKLRKVSKTVFIDNQNRLVKSGQLISMQFDKNGFNMGQRRAFLLSSKKNCDNMNLTFTAYMRGTDLSGYRQFNEGGVLTDAEFNQNATLFDWYFVQEGA